MKYIYSKCGDDGFIYVGGAEGGRRSPSTIR